MRMTKWERLPLGIGATRLSSFDGKLEQKPVSSADRAEKIRALGDKIVREEMGEVTEKRVS